jgi:chromosome partitioning protein
MHTIALVTQKGGSGKSTLAIGLAIAAMQDGHKVRLIETDPQGTVSNWRRRRPHTEPLVETVGDGHELGHRLQHLADSGVTLTIVDTAGGETAMATMTMRAADLCLIPARPSPADIEGAAPTLIAIRKLGKPYAFVLNQTPVRGGRVEGAAAALSDTATELNDMGVLALPFIVLRNDQQDALGAGLAVTEYAVGGNSSDEIRGLWQWVSKKLRSAAPVHTPTEWRAAG